MVSEYTPKRDSDIDDAPFGRDGVVSFEDDPDEDDGDGLVAAGSGAGGEVAVAGDGIGGEAVEGVVAGAKGEGGYDGGMVDG